MDATTLPKALDDAAVADFWERGYLRVPAVFTPQETAELADELDRMIVEWSFREEWTGAWRESYIDAAKDADTRFDGLHDVHLYSGAWTQAVTNPRLVGVLTALLGPDVEFHHTTMHVKVPETGQPFPLHQDHWFYPHADGRYVDVLVHLDDTRHENGEIRFLEGSHRDGPIDHVIRGADGMIVTPHLPPAEWPIADTVPVPANAGDVVLFNINTVHGSYTNTTSAARRLVRIGYRHPDNEQLAAGYDGWDGQAFGRPGLMVAGYRKRRDGQHAFW